MNEPINFEIAKLLKENGFGVPVNCGYGKNGKLYHILDMAIDFEEAKSRRMDNFNKLKGTYVKVSAPTITEVVMWLFKTYGIWISCERTLEIENYVFGYTVYYGEAPQKDGGVCADEEIGFGSPTTAYEAAIKYALNNLI